MSAARSGAPRRDVAAGPWELSFPNGHTAMLRPTPNPCPVRRSARAALPRARRLPSSRLSPVRREFLHGVISLYLSLWRQLSHSLGWLASWPDGTGRDGTDRPRGGSLVCCASAGRGSANLPLAFLSDSSSTWRLSAAVAAASVVVIVIIIIIVIVIITIVVVVVIFVIFVIVVLAATLASLSRVARGSCLSPLLPRMTFSSTCSRRARDLLSACL